jgi:ABC-type Fe3+-citrate transport system substrate-binding protein
LQVELHAAQSKVVKDEHRERALTSENGDLKKDLESMSTVHDAVVKKKAELQKTEHVKLQRFQDSVRQWLVKLRRNTEASVAMLDGSSAEFSTSTSLSDILEWFLVEVVAMPTAFVECNENITCYALIGVF